MAELQKTEEILKMEMQGVGRERAYSLPSVEKVGRNAEGRVQRAPLPKRGRAEEEEREKRARGIEDGHS